jgi:Flp pilus assembly CpaF family ATPase
MFFGEIILELAHGFGAKEDEAEGVQVAVKQIRQKIAQEVRRQCHQRQPRCGADLHYVGSNLVAAEPRVEFQNAQLLDGVVMLVIMVMMALHIPKIN